MFYSDQREEGLLGAQEEGYGNRDQPKMGDRGSDVAEDRRREEARKALEEEEDVPRLVKKVSKLGDKKVVRSGEVVKPVREEEEVLSLDCSVRLVEQPK